MSNLAYNGLDYDELVELVDGSLSFSLREDLFSVLFDLEKKKGEESLDVVEWVEETHS